VSGGSLAAAVVWLSVGGILYGYVGLALLLRPLAALVPDRRRGRRADAGARPLVTVVIPAYNEEAHLDARIRNVLASDYPRERLDVIVVSDASTDRTDAIARGFDADGVRLIVQEKRSGKTAGLNRAMAVARGEIAVFTDANASFPAEAIARMVAYFEDPTVGLVTGFTRYAVGSDGDLAEATNAYTSLERAIKRAESRWGMCVGADGAIFSMRRSLYRPLRDDDINDLVLPLGVVDQGYRCLLAEDAYCSEGTGKSVDSEFRRQSRIANRSLRAIWRNRHLLNPVRFPRFSFLLWSHKVARLLVPLFMTSGLVALAVLAIQGEGYRWLAAAGGIVLLVAAATHRRHPRASSRGVLARAVRLVHLLAVTNLAVLHGWWRFARGHAETTWQHDRSLEPGGVVTSGTERRS
jgi:cellulose synthase/poly-beta-1,6-N-acetylglucosamine synthase-like glycosyltransferase